MPKSETRKDEENVAKSGQAFVRVQIESLACNARHFLMLLWNSL